MAICTICNQEMLGEGRQGCTQQAIQLGDTRYPRIRYGEETYGNFIDYSPECHDCAVVGGVYHHLGCDVDECPKCHGQAFICACRHEGESDEEAV